MVRGSGKFKTRRGGGRSFSKNMELNEDGIAVGRPRKPAGEDVDEEEEEEEEEESEEESEEEEGGTSKQPATELSRAERKALKKQGKGTAAGEEDEDADLINPNHVAAKNKKLSEVGSSAPRQLSRREREEKEKKEAKERYWKLHLEGKTDQAKSDLARLAQVKKDREEAAAKRKAEQEAKKAEIEAKIAAQRKK